MVTNESDGSFRQLGDRYPTNSPARATAGSCTHARSLAGPYHDLQVGRCQHRQRLPPGREHGLPWHTATANLVRSPELGRALARDLGPAAACLMPQHGLLAVGRDVAHAVMSAILLERACAVQPAARAAGELKHWTGERESLEKAALVWSDGQIEAGWQYWTRRAGDGAGGGTRRGV
ncbi:class II aldolase/adducin family protein [Kitasatospora sp. NBC_01250]|uniref:class II aldolase/adducin family protein n=1 Tax=Kitasatospora sp. NBC_01250 TaxID=2903571 RepID=UPI002E36A7D0|nr:class II aldolase/adducin family protein [Kitasatospora sp. NBC_01250]